MLISAEHELFSAYNYEKGKQQLVVSHLLAEKFACSAMLSKKKMQLLVIKDLLAVIKRCFLMKMSVNEIQHVYQFLREN